jgi:chloramphenicol 3-O phosphotransferase
VNDADAIRARGDGRIILINGTSSSGKTTVVHALQATLPEIWLEMGIDRFAYALPTRVAGSLVWPQLFRYAGPMDHFRIETTPRGRQLVSGMHHAVAALAATGLNVIVDQVVLERSWLEECADLWKEFAVLFVGLRCPIDVVVQRELERKDRTFGQARAQFDVIHRWADYDMEIDTSVVAPAEASAQIIAALAFVKDRRGARLVRRM